MKKLILNIHKTILNLVKPHKNPKLLLGLSGGSDSVFLFHMLLQLKKESYLTFACGHLDHEWRKDSHKDTEFCKQLCEKHAIPFYEAKASKFCNRIKHTGSKEDYGRRIRHLFFSDLLKKIKADSIILAHQAQDQQETFFWRMIRGSTLSGLTCMKPKEGMIIRPLLSISKETIISYLNDHKIPYLKDSTNDSDAHLRNRIRKYVLPAIRECDERFDEKFKTTLSHLQKDETYLQKVTTQTFENVFSIEKSGTLIGNLTNFTNLNPVIQRRLIIFWLCKEGAPFHPSTSYLEEIIRFLLSTHGGTHQLHPSWAITKKGRNFSIVKQYSQSKTSIHQLSCNITPK